MLEYITYRVFTDKEGNFGNPVGIVLDTGKEVSTQNRVLLTKKSGFSELVFINCLYPLEIEIFNPKERVNFAGHALIGLGQYLLESTDNLPCQVQLMRGTAQLRFESGIIWISANLEYLPKWIFKKFSSSTEIESIKVSETSDWEHTVAWSWIDKATGKIRARTFAPDWGVAEDEANGSGCMLLAHDLLTDLQIVHGKGSHIYARSSESNRVEVGGMVTKS